MTGRYDAILFDFDGVLLDSEPIHFECWNQALQRFGIVLNWPEYQQHFIGVTDRTMIQYLCDIAQPPVPFDEMWACYPAKSEIYRSRVSNGAPFAAETVTLVRELCAHPMAVVSSSPRRDVEPLLEAAGIRDCFRLLVCAEDVARHKPDPEPYRVAAERLGAASPLVIEDSRSGIESGRAAGFDVLEVADATQMAQAVRERLGL